MGYFLFWKLILKQRVCAISQNRQVHSAIQRELERLRFLALLWLTKRERAKLAVWPWDSSWICFSRRLLTSYQVAELDNKQSCLLSCSTCACSSVNVCACVYTSNTLEQTKPNPGVLHSCFNFKIQSLWLHFKYHYFGSRCETWISSLYSYRAVLKDYSLLENCQFVTKFLKLKCSL